MQPSEEYAQKREEAIALIRRHAPQRLQQPLIDLLRPAIALSATRAEDAQIPVGASKFGGAPDVPAGFEWPLWNEKLLGFLAQINLAEVAPFDVEALLPKSGLLSFFAAPFNWDDENKLGMWRVFWCEDSLQRASANQYSPYTLSCSIVIQMGEPAFTAYEPLFGDENEFWFSPELKTLFETWGQQIETKGLRPNQLLGNAWVDEGRWMEATCQEDSQTPDGSATDDWRLLFQMESDYDGGPTWGDAGTASFWLRKSDLAAHKFDKVWMITESA